MDTHHIDNVISYSLESLKNCMFKIIITFSLSIILTGDCFSQHHQEYNNNLNRHFYKDSLRYNYIDDRCDSASRGTGGKKTKIINYRNPHAAVGLAIVPGILIHGAGHLYVRKYKTVAVLLVATFLGFYFDRINYDDSGLDDASVVHSGRVYRYPESKKFLKHPYHDFLSYSSKILFFGSWAYDIIGAPIVCIRHNKRIKQKLSFNPYLTKNQSGNQIGIQLTYHF